MSELYDHLRRLQEKPQRIVDEGVPFPTSRGPREESSRAKRSKRVLLAVPVMCVVLGLLTVAAVVAVRKFSRDVVPTKPEAMVKIPSGVREHPSKGLRLEAEQAPKLSDVAREKVHEGKGDGATDRVALETVTVESGGAPPKDALPGAEPPTTHVRLESPQTVPSENTPKAPEETKVSALAVGASTEEVSSKRNEASTQLPGFEHESIAKKPSDAERGLSRDAALLALPTAPQVGFKRPAGRSPQQHGETTSGQSPKKGQTPRDGAGEAPRQVLVIAEEARRLGNWEEAARGYREYLAQRSDPEVMNNLGAVLLAQGRFVEAEHVLVQARDRSADPDIGANLAAAYWFQGKREAACELLIFLQENSSTAESVQTLRPLVDQCRRVP